MRHIERGPDSALATSEVRRAHQPRRLSVVTLQVVLALAMMIIVGEVLLNILIPDVQKVYLRDIVQTGKEPAFLLTLAFLSTFGVVRFITYSIRTERVRAFRNVTTKGGLHIHHLVPGMLLVLVSGYLALVLPSHPPPPTSLLAVLFGVGAALVLDEFALWLRLADVYWEPEGRESVDAVILAGGVCVLYLLGLDFWPHLVEAVFGTISSGA